MQDTFDNSMAVAFDHRPDRYLCRVLIETTLVLSTGQYVTIPVDFESDFNSLGAAFYLKYSPFDRWMKAMAVYEYLARGGWVRFPASNPQQVNAHTAKEIFIEALKRCAVDASTIRNMSLVMTFPGPTGYWSKPDMNTYQYENMPTIQQMAGDLR